ncbi:hypothetical protein FS749_003630 [Ceratobasidium sp. UAMH 11750]|nr:hypothetical protein FS749_003630 [Ceratobasidium sp. UAMH 11750]
MSSIWKAAQANVVRNLSLAGTALIANQLVGAQEEDNSLTANPSHGPDGVADVFEGFEGFEGFEEVEGVEGFDNFDVDVEMDLDKFNAGFDDAFEPFDDLDEELDGFPLFDDRVDAPKIPPIRPVYQDVEELEGGDGDKERRAVDVIIGAILIAFAQYISGLRGPYNQITKSEDWFKVSMNWPPTWFRRVYR